MWAVTEQPFLPALPSLVSGLVVRHLVEDGEDETACGEPITGSVVSTPWSRTTDRCPACEQAQGIS